MKIESQKPYVFNSYIRRKIAAAYYRFSVFTHSLIKRKDHTMTIEKKAEALLEAATNLINAVTDMVKGQAPTTAAAPPPEKDKATKTKVETKKELSEIKALAKAKAGSILKDFGKAKLAELLKKFKAKKFTDIKGEAADFQKFIDEADAMIADKKADNDDDLLGTSDDDVKKEYTLEDVKAALLKVNNAEGLGRDVIKQILADLGVARLGELKADKFNAAMERANAALEKAENVAEAE